MCFVKIEFATVACSDLVLALACLSLERVTRRVEGGRVARGRARSRRRGERSAVDRRAGVAPRVAVRRAGVRVDGERLASGSHGARACPSPSGGARAGDGARSGNGGVAVDGGRGVGRGDRPSAVEGSVDGEALARGTCSVLPNLRVVM